MPAAAIDAAKVIALRSDLGEETARRLIAGFMDELDTRLAALTEAHASDDPEATRKAAHALRSVSLEYGATALADLAEAIEAGGPTDPAALEACRARTVLALETLVGTAAG